MTLSGGGESTRRALSRILACLPDDLASVQAEARRIDDWRALLSTARAHGVGGVVSEGARRAGVALPEDVASEHAAQLLREDLRQESLRRTLRDVNDALADARVESAMLKGPALAARLYDRAEVRPSTDLDVLIAPASLDAAASALAALGYALEGGPAGRFFREHHHHVHLVHRVLPVVELHVEAYRGFGTAMLAAPLLARAVRCDVAELGDALVLSPEDEWLYLAVHAASHRFERLSWLYDLKLLAHRHPELRWDLIAARARELRLSTALALTVRLLSTSLGLHVPGASNLARVSGARARAAEALSRPRASHVVNAATSVAFSAVACDVEALAAFGARYLRVKLFHEAPMRAGAFFASS